MVRQDSRGGKGLEGRENILYEWPRVIELLLCWWYGAVEL